MSFGKKKGDAIMICLNCGEKVNDSQRFCKRCGAKVNPLAKDDADIAKANDGGKQSRAKKAPSKTATKPVVNATAKQASEKAAEVAPKQVEKAARKTPAKSVSKKATASAPNVQKPHAVGLSTDEKAVPEKPESSKKEKAAKQGAQPASRVESAKSSKSATSSPIAAGSTVSKPDFGFKSEQPNGGNEGYRHQFTKRVTELEKPQIANGPVEQRSVVSKPASPKRRRNTAVAIASGSLAAAILAVAVFLMAGPIQPFDVETPTVCTKATRVSPSDETGKVLNSYKVSLIDRKTGKEVSSRQLKKSDGFALGDFEDENGQPISDGDYMLRYEDMESGNIYDGRYIDVRDGDSAAVASTTGITGSSDKSLYSDKKEIERLNQELQNFSIREQQMKEQQGALYAENEGLKAELGAAEQKKGEYEAVIEAGAVELEKKQKTIDDQDEKIDGLEKDLKKADSDIAKLKNDVAEKEKEVDPLKKEVGEKQETIDSLKKEIGEKQKEIDSLNEEISNLKGGHTNDKELKEKQDEIDSLNEEISNLKGGHANGKELKEKQDEIDSLKADISKKQEEIDGLKKRVEELEAKPQGNTGGNKADDESDDGDTADAEDDELEDEEEE